jgi:PAS domain S-box-containing protein
LTTVHQNAGTITTGTKNSPQNFPEFDCGQLIGALPAAIYTCDAEGKINFFNPAAIELWGREPEIGKERWCGSWKIFRNNGSALPLEESPMALTLLENGSVKEEEIIIERPDGARLNVLSHPQRIYDDNGQVVGAINMLVDVTEKRKAEKILFENEEKFRLLSQSLEKNIEERTRTFKQSEERYHKMIEEVQDYAIILLDKEGTIINWNKGAEKIKGYTEKEILGQNFRNFYLDEDRQRKLPEHLIDEAAKHGRAMHEGWRKRKDGSKFWGSIVITALHDQENNVIGFSKVTRDLTEKKINEDQLKAYAHELENQNQQLEEYAHIASHDLQEPLRKIKTFANLLLKNINDKAAVSKSLDKINSAAERMEMLIKEVLRYSEISSTDDLFEPTDLNRVLEQVKEDYELLIAQTSAKI